MRSPQIGAGKKAGSRGGWLWHLSFDGHRTVRMPAHHHCVLLGSQHHVHLLHVLHRLVRLHRRGLGFAACAMSVMIGTGVLRGNCYRYRYCYDGMLLQKENSCQRRKDSRVREAAQREAAAVPQLEVWQDGLGLREGEEE